MTIPHSSLSAGAALCSCACHRTTQQSECTQCDASSAYCIRDKRVSPPVQHFPYWRLVLTDGRVVEVNKSRGLFYPITEHYGVVLSATIDHERFEAVGMHDESAIRQLVYNIGRRVEIVPPGQLTAAERVAAERRNSEAREEAAYLRGLNDACAECDRQLRVCADSGHADAIAEAESRGAERERTAVVAWLREIHKPLAATFGRCMHADAIERGEHTGFVRCLGTHNHGSEQCGLQRGHTGPHGPASGEHVKGG